MTQSNVKLKTRCSGTESMKDFVCHKISQVKQTLDKTPTSANKLPWTKAPFIDGDESCDCLNERRSILILTGR